MLKCVSNYNQCYGSFISIYSPYKIKTMGVVLAKILVVDDDISTCKFISRSLSQKNYQVKEAYDGETALKFFDEFIPDLVILDVNLPDYLGYNLCEEMQQRRDVYILMLTNRSEKTDKHQGFLKGADDYLIKPCDIDELYFRIKAILRRSRISNNNPQEEILVFKNLTINPLTQEIKVDDQLINLTNLEFKLLYFLAKFPERAWSRQELLKNVWNYNHVGIERVVDVHIGQIRRKIEIDAKGPCLIDTVRGVGYKFNPHLDPNQ